MPGLQSTEELCSLEPDGAAFAIDVAAPDAERYFSSRRVGVYARLEERWPADPGELSGAKLRIAEDFSSVVAEIGGTLQPYVNDGFRCGHLLGFVEDNDFRALAEMDLLDGPIIPRTICLTQAKAHQEPWSGQRLEILTGDDGAPELRLYISQHCLGVLRGEPLLKFLRCLRVRHALGEE